MENQLEIHVKTNSNQQVGNYLQASQHFNPGDVIICEPPLVIGPNHLSIPVCLECLEVIKPDQKCPFCHWGLCAKCLLIENKSWHSPEECGQMKAFQGLIYEAVMPLRLVKEALINSEAWTNHLSHLEDHVDKKIGLKDWEIFHTKVKVILKIPKNATFLGFYFRLCPLFKTFIKNLK